MNCAEYVKVIGRCYDKRVTNDEVDYILWNHTGFPSFWPSGAAPRQTLRHQVAEYFRGIRRHPETGLRYWEGVW